MKAIIRTILLAISIIAISCQGKTNTSVIQGAVSDIDHYGGLHATFTAEDLEQKGVTYGDLLEITIGDMVITAPYVDAYTESGNMSPCLCNYNRMGEEFGIAMANGSFALHVGGQVGDTLIIRMKEKGGYLREYNLLQGTYTYNREDYVSDEVFANFREVTAGSIASGVLYRSTSPINFEKNKVRYSYAADLCRQYGVQTIVDIADSDEKIDTYLHASENEGSYMLSCLAAKHIVGLGSNADYLDSPFMDKLSHAVRQMLVMPAPYLIHCNEGKDRTGFYFLLLEALCGATIEEMKIDYMQTFENLYHQQRGSEQYELTWQKNGYRMLYLIAHPETWGDVKSIDWDKVQVEETALHEAAVNYLQTAGLTLDEITRLQNLLTDSPIHRFTDSPIKQ